MTDNPKWLEFAAKVQPKIATKTAEQLKEWRGKKHFQYPPLQQDIDIYQALLNGGKKMRSTLAMLSYSIHSGCNLPTKIGEDTALTVASLWEVMQSSFLIHDDIEDNSDLRRGLPTAHVIYQRGYEEQKGPLDSKHYGNAIAINTGSLGLVRIFTALGSIDMPATQKVDITNWFAEVIEKTVAGQRRDLTHVDIKDLSVPDIYRIYHGKTAMYSTIGPLVLGGKLAGASGRDNLNLNSYGVNTGLAFQLVDDHLGLFGDEKETGKPVGSDISEAKKTLHIVEGFKRGSAEDRKLIKDLWGNQNVKECEIEQLRVVMNRLGIKEEMLKRANTFAIRAKNVIPNITANQDHAQMLAEIADFMVVRVN